MRYETSIVSVHIDIAEFAAQILFLPESERGEWVTEFARALTTRDPDSASHQAAGDYADRLLSEAREFMATRSDKARKAANRRHRAGGEQPTEQPNPANAYTNDAHAETFLLQSRAEQNRAEQYTPPSPNGDGSPRRRPPAYTIPLPLSLIPSFSSWWQKWIDHRRQARHQITPTEAQLQLEELLDDPDPVGTIRNAISGGCQRLRRTTTPPPGPKPPPESARQPLPPSLIPLDDAVRLAKGQPTTTPVMPEEPVNGNENLQPA